MEELFFFHLIKKYTIRKVYLGDINNELILTWKIVKHYPEDLIHVLKAFELVFLRKSFEERKDYYYYVREEFNNNLKNFDYNNLGNEQVFRAAQMIFLNRTCFNGLYRVNKSGKFNVPVGRYKNPSICDEKNLLSVSKKLEDIDIVCADYSKCKKYIKKNSFIYLDPPYLPIKKTSFTSYDSTGFGVKEQIELSNFCKEIDEEEAYFLLSNSDPKNEDSSCDFFKKYYCRLKLKHCEYRRIEVRRSINSNGKKRGPINELLIFNYDPSVK